jgi:hypothetical protein
VERGLFEWKWNPETPRFVFSHGESPTVEPNSPMVAEPISGHFAQWAKPSEIPDDEVSKERGDHLKSPASLH